MGNSASAQPDDTDGCLPEDLFDLTDRQLKVLWENRPLSIHEIQQAARALKQTTSPHKQQQQQSEDESPYLSGLYYFRDQGPEPSPESELAVGLCELLSELALLRFRLVPTRLKEGKFWIATLMLLKERLVEYNAARYVENELEGDHEPASNQLHNTAQTNGKSHKTTKATNASSNGSTSDHARQVQIQKVQIAKLQRQVQQLQAALAAASTSSSQQSDTSTKSNTKSKSNHKGTWKMDPDSQEFLQYPDEVKDSLRKEKQRRLQQVHKEMKFILDSDEIHHTNGKWECCGEPKYHASCSM